MKYFHVKIFERLRKESPVHYQRDHEVVGSFWNVTRYQDIMSVDTDPATYSSEGSIVATDPEEEFPNPANEDQGDPDANSDSPLRDVDADIDHGPFHEEGGDLITGYELLMEWNGKIDGDPIGELQHDADAVGRFDWLVKIDPVTNWGPDGNQSDDPVNNDIISHIEGINPRFMDSLGTMMESKDLASAWG